MLFLLFSFVCNHFQFVNRRIKSYTLFIVIKENENVGIQTNNVIIHEKNVLNQKQIIFRNIETHILENFDLC
jgi:hypothetical protein